MAAHRYWQMVVVSTADTYITINEVELRETTGGSDVSGSGTATASYSRSGYEPSRMFDNDTGTDWETYNQTYPQSWTYDFGSGNAYEINEIVITPHSSYYSQAPAEFAWKYSDDGTNWTTQRTLTGITWPNSNSQTFDVSLDEPVDDAIGVSKAVAYAAIIDIQESINVSKVIAYAVLSESTAEPPYDDGTPDGGIVFGGNVVAVGTANYQDGTPDGGIVFGGGEVSDIENHQVDGAAAGGIVFGGSGTEQWQAIPNTTVAVKGGTYRISGALYTLAETLTVSGLGSVAAIVDCGAAPSTAGLYRYDLISINATGAITVTAGTEAATPVMPATPSSQVKLDHVLRYYGQTQIVQADIGKMYSAPQLTTLTAVVTDDELAWAEASTAITITCRDQYGQLYTGGKVVNASITTGNGTIAPASRSGAASSFSFTYTRDQEVTDVSPVITFSSPTGPFTTAFVRLLDSDGDLMT